MKYSVLQGHRHNGDQAARRPHMMCICGCWFTTPLLGYVGIGISSFGITPMYSCYLPIDTYGLSLIVFCNFKGGLFDPRFGELCGCGRRGCAHSMARPWVPNSSPLTHKVYLLTVFELFSWLKSVSVRPGYGDKYCSGSCRFVEQQKLMHT